MVVAILRPSQSPYKEDFCIMIHVSQIIQILMLKFIDFSYQTIIVNG